MCLLAVLLAGHFRPCQAVEAQKRSRRLWWASVAAVVAASLLDVASSRGGVETNPLLQTGNGTFDTRRALMLKSVAMEACWRPRRGRCTGPGVPVGAPRR